MRIYINNKEKKIDDPTFNALSDIVMDGVFKINEIKTDIEMWNKIPSAETTPKLSTFKIYNKKNERKFTPLYLPEIKEVLFNDPATIVWFEDGSKSVAIAGHGDKYDRETGLATCLIKRVLGNKRYRQIMDAYCYPKIDKEKMN